MITGNDAQGSYFGTYELDAVFVFYILILMIVLWNYVKHYATKISLIQLFKLK